MPETGTDRKIYSLSAIAESIRRALCERSTGAYWIKAEMNKVHLFPQSGHCFPELLEKRDGRIVAKMQATLWKDDYLRINRSFMEVLKEPLKDGITILLCAKVAFDPLHGLSLHIIDIDPCYTLGQLAIEKQETIDRLKKEGLFERNKSLAMPRLPKTIAVISGETSRGYADFQKIVDTNAWGYKIDYVLFPALLDGDKAVASFIGTLQKVKRVSRYFDAVALIRGGGGDAGMNCYNRYALCREIASFPIPVITGIGHSTNETVAEMISFKNAITPTDVADYLLQIFRTNHEAIMKAEDLLVQRSCGIMNEEQLKFRSTMQLFRSATGAMLERRRSDLDHEGALLVKGSSWLLQSLHDEHDAAVTNFSRCVRTLLANEKRAVTDLSLNFKSAAGQVLRKSDEALVRAASDIGKDSRRMLLQEAEAVDRIRSAMAVRVQTAIKNERTEIDHMQKQIALVDPINVLKRGYTITQYQGHFLKDVNEVEEGGVLTTMTANGEITSVAKSIHKTE